MQIYRRWRFFKIGRFADCSHRQCVINAHLTLQTCRPRLVAASALADIFIVYYFSVSFLRETNKDRARGVLNYLWDSGWKRRLSANDNFSSGTPCECYKIMRVVLWTTRVQDCCMTSSAKENGGLELWLTSDFIHVDMLDFINLI